MNKRKRAKQPNKTVRAIYAVIFVGIITWLLISIIKKQNPLNVLAGSISNISSNSDSSWESQIAEKDSIIADLRNRLAAYEGSQINRRALVIIDSETLNMRSGPSLGSNILEKIPANSEIQLLYYDNNTYYINSEAGKWAKVIYAGIEGWVWGNYIREI